MPTGNRAAADSAEQAALSAHSIVVARKLLLHSTKPSHDELYKAKRASERNPERSFDTLIAQESALFSPSACIMAFEGANDDNLFESSRPKWEQEVIDRETIKLLYDRIFELNKEEYNPSEVIYSANKEKLWTAVLDACTWDEVKEKLGTVDPKNLTPYQAAYLSGLIAARKLKYDKAQLAYRLDISELRDEYSTSDPELLQQILTLKSDPEALKKWVLDRVYTYDQLLADELLDLGSGVCRHIAAVSAAIFDAIKEKQSGNKLYGTYLLYYAPVGALSEGISDQYHAYNVLIITGRKIDGEGNEVVISVVDPTWEPFLGDLDQTHRRLSSGLTLIRNYGQTLGLTFPEEDYISMADQLLDRMREVPHDKASFNDFISIVKCSSVGRNDNINYSYSMRYALDRTPQVTRPTMIIKAFESASSTYLSGSNLYLKRNMIAPLYEEIAALDLSKRDHRTEIIVDAVRKQFRILEGHPKTALKLFFDTAWYPTFEQALRTYVERHELPNSDEERELFDGAIVVSYPDLEAKPVLKGLIDEYRKIEEQHLKSAIAEIE